LPFLLSFLTTKARDFSSPSSDLPLSVRNFGTAGLDGSLARRHVLSTSSRMDSTCCRLLRSCFVVHFVREACCLFTSSVTTDDGNLFMIVAETNRFSSWSASGSCRQTRSIVSYRLLTALLESAAAGRLRSSDMSACV